MKKFKIGLFVISILIFMIGLINSSAQTAKERVPNLEKIELIHWEKEVGRQGWKESFGKTRPPLCYAFIGQYGKTLLKWGNLPVNYVINPINPNGLDEFFVCSAISNGAEEWDIWTGIELFSNTYKIDHYKIAGVQDYTNVISWGDYLTTGIIGVTTIWYNPVTKKIIEFDIMLDIDWSWGDATLDSNVMDLQNIVTHELGHGAGLGDVYETGCKAATMYGYSEYGETQKRDLEQSDQKGLQKLYGSL